MSEVELPLAFLSHSMPNRMRLHVPSMRQRRDYFTSVRERLIGVHGVTRVATNTRTAGILIEHREPIDIEAAGVDHALFRVAPDEVHPHLSAELHSVADRADELLTGMTQGRVDLTGAAALMFAGLGVRQMVRGDALPAGLSLLWSAVALLRRVQE